MESKNKKVDNSDLIFYLLGIVIVLATILAGIVLATMIA